MKSFVALLVLAAVAVAEPDAQFIYAANPHAQAGLTTYANGAVVPTDTLSVQAAKAQHFAAKANAYAFPYYGYYGAHLIGKREAEADAQFYYSPSYYAGPHTSVGLTVYPDGAVTPTETAAVQAAKAQHFATKALTYGAYGAYPYYGAHLIGKREAEPEAKADPQVLYSSYYSGYPYTYYGYGYPYAYGTHLIGKREAKAEAEAKPDAQFLYNYGYYGYPYTTYGYPYAYGNYAYLG